MKANILVVEDQFIEANNLRLTLRKAGYFVFPIAHSVADALEILEQHRPDIVLLDILLQGERTGIDLAHLLRERNIAFVYLSANSDKKYLDLAVATKPYGFLVKPFREQDVLVMLDVAWYRHRHNQEQRSAKDGDMAATPIHIPDLIGDSPAFREVMRNVHRVAPSDTSVLLLGESGTGKELIARTLHVASSRRVKPFVVVNCAALPAELVEAELFGHDKGAFTGASAKRVGKFEQADGGTIFLDEVGELPTDLQVKFLRVLQEREIEPIGGQKKTIDVRVIAATNRILEEEIAAGRFRLDLYYRLNVFPIYLPPLRQRKEDLEPLAMHFLRVHAAQENKAITAFSKSVLRAVTNYSWPGNIREMENLIARSVLMSNGPTIELLAIPEATQGRPPSGDLQPKTIEENERDHILAVLKKCHWRVRGRGGAAEVLDINPSTLYSRLKKLGIEKAIKWKTSD
jgi:DNA-binding NtrC family response regulator